MYLKTNRKMTALAGAVIFLAFSLFGYFDVHALPTAPAVIKIGLAYGTTAANQFNFKSPAGLKVSVEENGIYKPIIEHNAAAGLTIRKDAYYNIIGTETKEINYTKAAAYKGEVIGPYHIQIGDVFADLSEAKKVAEQAASFAPSVFLAYEAGWRVWAQLYLDEAECLTQIQIWQNEHNEFTYSVVLPDKKRVQLQDAVSGRVLYILNNDVGIQFTAIPALNATPTIEYKKLKYRGSLIIKRLKDSDISITNELPFEEYLYGVVPTEVPYTWHMEALKAQAVAARNYAMVSKGRHNTYGFDLCDGQHCQAYKGYGQENKRTNEAVQGTKGKLLFHSDKLVNTVYHSTSGGWTENSENIWFDAIPYLRAVEDKYEVRTPYSNWVKEFEKAYIKDKMIAAQMDVGDILDIVPLSVSDHGRVLKVQIKGTKGNKILEKEKIRYVLGTMALKSIWYTVSTDSDIAIKGSLNGQTNTKRPSGLYVLSASGTSPISGNANIGENNKIFVQNATNIVSYHIIPEKYIFEGKGFGHGLGMSQYGAKGMADAGFNYIQILEYYYTGAKVQ